MARSDIGNVLQERTKPPRDGCGGFTGACAACWDRQEFAGINSLRSGGSEVERGAPEKGPDSQDFATRSGRPCSGRDWVAPAWLSAALVSP